MNIDDAIRQLTEFRKIYGNLSIKTRCFGVEDVAPDPDLYDDVSIEIVEPWGVRMVVID